MTFKGQIPKSVRVIIRDSREIYFAWNQIDDKYNQDFTTNLTPFTGKQCAIMLTNSSLKKHKSIVEIDNKPMSGLRLIGHPSWSSTGDSILVCLPNNFLVSMEHDSFMEVVLNEGIKPGGILPGEWIWARVPGSMKLIRLGTGLHQAILDYESRARTSACKVRNLNVGCVYRNAEGESVVFLGFVNTVLMQLRLHPEDKNKQISQDRFGYRKNNDIRYNVAFNKVELATLWYDSYLLNELEKNRDKINKEINHKQPYGMKVLKNHKFIEELTTDKFVIPDDIIMATRNFAEINLVDNLKRVVQSEKRRAVYSHSQKISNIDLSSYTPTYRAAKMARKYVSLANMVPFGVEPILSETLSIFKSKKSDITNINKRQRPEK